jgi:hypothetical protein
MKNILRSLALFVFLSWTNSVFAQTLEYGLGFQIYVMPGKVLETFQHTNYNGPVTTSESVFAILPTISAQFSANFPILEREGFSIGLQPGVLANGMVRSSGFFIGTRGDAFATIRFGAGASYANYVAGKRYFGVGIGYSLYSVFNTCEEYTDKILFAKPSLYLLTGEDKSMTKLFFQLIPHHSVYPAYTGDIPKITYWQFGITWEGWRFFSEG